MTDKAPYVFMLLMWEAAFGACALMAADFGVQYVCGALCGVGVIVYFWAIESKP